MQNLRLNLSKNLIIQSKIVTKIVFAFYQQKPTISTKILLQTLMSLKIIYSKI
jgi:hypothetical protein